MVRWDMRMVALAAVVWGFSWMAHGLMSLIRSTSMVDTDEWSMIAPATVILFCVVTGLCVMAMTYGRPRAASTVMLVLCVALVSVVSTATQALDRWRSSDLLLSTGASRLTTVTMTFSGIVKTSSVRDADCRVDVVVRAIASESGGNGAGLPAVAFASDPICSRIVGGSTVEVDVTAVESPVGGEKPWLTISEGAVMTFVRGPSWLVRWRDSLHDDFFGVCRNLSDQGKVLVPGLTLGLLGSERYSSDDDFAVDSQYADYLGEGFSQVGIMHLMAVSGGHFMLVAAAVRRLCRMFRVPRWCRGLLTALSCAGLAAVMAPSDSVARALIMGVWSSGWMVLGRPSRSLVALSWTAIVVVVVDPSLSRSYGFSLSCAAVLGIVLLADGWKERMEPFLGGVVSSALSMTMAAQIATLPIQVMMEPVIPLVSPVSNLLVAPVVGVATVAGLSAFACASILPGLAGWLAVIASWGTAVMERTAMLMTEVPYSTIPWIAAPWGALVIVGVYVVAGVALRSYRVLRRRRRERRGYGRGFHRTPASRVAWWVRETVDVVRGWW